MTYQWMRDIQRGVWINESKACLPFPKAFIVVATVVTPIMDTLTLFSVPLWHHTSPQVEMFHVVICAIVWMFLPMYVTYLYRDHGSPVLARPGNVWTPPWFFFAKLMILAMTFSCLSLQFGLIVVTLANAFHNILCMMYHHWVVQREKRRAIRNIDREIRRQREKRRAIGNLDREIRRNDAGLRRLTDLSEMRRALCVVKKKLDKFGDRLLDLENAIEDMANDSEWRHRAIINAISQITPQSPPTGGISVSGKSPDSPHSAKKGEEKRESSLGGDVGRAYLRLIKEVSMCHRRLIACR